MKAFISYDELNELIIKKTNKPILLEKGGDDSVKVSYPLEINIKYIGKVRKNISGLMSVNEIKGTDVYISYSIHKGMELIIDGFRSYLGELIDKLPLLSWGSSKNQLILHLDQLAEMNGVKNIDNIMKYIENPTVYVRETGVELSFNLQNI